jgi:hypothetical protein
MQLPWPVSLGERQLDSRSCTFLRKKLAISNPARVCVVLYPPCLLARLSRRLRKLERFLRSIRVRLSQPELTMVKDSKRFHRIRNSDSSIANEQQVFPI